MPHYHQLTKNRLLAGFWYAKLYGLRFRKNAPMREQLKEQLIRPVELMAENAMLRALDISELMKHRDGFVLVPCPACEHEQYKVKFEKSGFMFVSCNACETVYINPRPTNEMVIKFFTTARSLKHWNDKIFPTSEESRRRDIFVPRANLVDKICEQNNVPKEALVDVGAGFGTFCQAVSELKTFRKTVAIEPCHELAQSCRKRGIDTIELPIEQVESNQFNVITSFEVLYHSFAPKQFLLSCRRILMPGGLLILTTPNSKGFDLLVAGKSADSLDGPNHMNSFNPYSLRLLLERCGFEVIEITTPGKLDAQIVRSLVLSGKLDISGCPFLKLVLIEEWERLGESFQDFLADNELSGHMWAVAKKV